MNARRLCSIAQRGVTRRNGVRTMSAVSFLAVVFAADLHASETARQILDRQRALDQTSRGWTDRHEQLRMEVRDPARARRELVVDLFDKKFPERQQRTMAYFSVPDSVKGTAFFAVTRPDGPADQWLYLPEAKRARRIGGELRKQGFVGTDFTYHDLDLLADMPSWSEATASSALRGEERVDDVPCYVIELTPRREDIGYQRIVVWLGRDDLVARRVDFFDAAPATGWFGFGAAASDGLPTRRFHQSDVRVIGSIPVAYRAEVETPSAGSRTIVTFTQIAFDQDLPDELFSQAAMDWGGFSPASH
jgi:hypothetical protein